MHLISHIFQLILFLVIFFGPACLSLTFIVAKQKSYVERSIAYHLLSFLTIWSGIQICIALLAGLTGHFEIWTVFWIEFIILVIGLGILIGSVRSSSTSLIIPPFCQQLTITSELTLTFYILCLSIILFLQSSTQPIIDFDSLWYHLPSMARWHQDFSFTKLPEFSRFTASNSITEQVGYYPYSWEALCTLFILPFKEDFLVALPNLIAWVILGLSTYLLGLEFGASQFYALATSISLLVIPINLQQINTLHIDLPLATFFASSAFFAVTYQRTHSLQNFFLSILSISILVGIKTSGLIYTALIILILFLSSPSLILQSKREFRTNLQKREILIIIAILIPIIFLASFWYFKNFIEVGNPLGNFSVKLFGFTIFPGSLDSSKIHGTTLASLFNPFNLENWKALLVQVVGRLQLPFVIFAGLNILLIPYFRQVFARFNRKQVLSLFILLFGSGFLYWNTPYSAAVGPPWILSSQIFGQGLRFSLPFLGMLSVISAVILTQIKVHKKYVIRIVLLCCILGLANIFIYDIIRIQGAFKANVGGGTVLLYSLFQNFKQNPSTTIINFGNTMGDVLFNPLIFMGFYFISIFLLKPLSLVLSNFFDVISYYPRSVQMRKFITIGIIVFVALGLITFGIREQRSSERTSIYGDTFKYVSEKLKVGEKIGYIFSSRSYLLYGEKLDKKVIYLSPKTNEPICNSDNFHKLDISFIALGPFKEGSFLSTKEVDCIVENQNSFTPLLDLDPNSSQALYKISVNP